MINTRYIKLLDGSIQFIKRGMPPMEVPGYEVDPGDPYIFHPILPNCKHRVFKSISLDCCPEPKNIRYCEKYGYIAVSPAMCVDCDRKGNREE